MEQGKLKNQALMWVLVWIVLNILLGIWIFLFFIGEAGGIALVISPFPLYMLFKSIKLYLKLE